MGWTPAQVDACSLWDFRAAFAQWKAFNTVPKDGGGPRAPSVDALKAAVESDMRSTMLH